MSDLEQLREVLLQRMEAVSNLADEPMPDWYNMHDYSSGFYYGRKSSAQSQIDLILEILDRLEKLS
jgi:hypothetical protein